MGPPFFLRFARIYTGFSRGYGPVFGLFLGILLTNTYIPPLRGCIAFTNLIRLMLDNIYVTIGPQALKNSEL